MDVEAVFAGKRWNPTLFGRNVPPAVLDRQCQLPIPQCSEPSSWGLPSARTFSTENVWNNVYWMNGILDLLLLRIDHEFWCQREMKALGMICICICIEIHIYIYRHTYTHTHYIYYIYIHTQMYLPTYVSICDMHTPMVSPSTTGQPSMPSQGLLALHGFFDWWSPWASAEKTAKTPTRSGKKIRIIWVVPPPRIPVANEGLGWDPLLKM